MNWDYTLWRNTLAEYGYAIGMALLVTLGVLLVVRVYTSRMHRTGETGRLPFYLLWHALHCTKWWLIFPLALIVTSLSLTMPLSFYPWLRMFFVTLFIVQVLYWGNRALEAWGDRYTPEQAQEMGSHYTTMKMFIFFGRIFFIGICLLVMIDSLPGVEITALVASLGIGGIAVALAVQNILSDIFASLSITVDKPFVLGDFIIVDDFLGSVEHIGLKTTRVRSLSGEQLVFSNNDLLGSRIRNFKRMYQRRVVFKIEVTYDTPPEKIRIVPPKIKEVIESLPDLRFDRAHFVAHGEYALVFEVVYYVGGPDFNLYMDRQQAINLAIHEFFQEQGIKFAVPTRTLYLKQDDPSIESALKAVAVKSAPSSPDRGEPREE